MTYGSNSSEDHQYFNRLAREVEQCHPATVRRINRLLHDHLHPERTGLQEPAVKVNVKGRPRGSTSTKREKSSWEHSRGRGRPHGKSRPPRSTQGRGSTSSHGRGNSGSTQGRATSGSTQGRGTSGSTGGDPDAGISDFTYMSCNIK